MPFGLLKKLFFQSFVDHKSVSDSSSYTSLYPGRSIAKLVLVTPALE